jgi:hypothetical protein
VVTRLLVLIALVGGAAPAARAEPPDSETTHVASRGTASVSATLGREYGVRIDVDAVAWRHLVIGAAVSAQIGALEPGNPPVLSAQEIPSERDLDAFATIGYEHDLLGWHARATAGVGLQATYLHDLSCMCTSEVPPGTGQPTMVFAMQASLTLSYALAARWELLLGALVTVLPHKLATVYIDQARDLEMQADLGGVSPAGMLGAGYRW